MTTREIVNLMIEMGYIGEKVECYICTEEWIAVYHEDTERLECPNCSNMIQI